jgi:hypothetical protein
MDMKAIRTKYVGPTNTRGARIIAKDEDGNRVSISYPHELSGEDVYRAAADALCAKMKWPGNLIGGGTKDGYVFVFGPDWKACARASNRIADLVSAVNNPNDKEARKLMPTATWAEIIASELGIQVPEVHP